MIETARLQSRSANQWMISEIVRPYFPDLRLSFLAILASPTGRFGTGKYLPLGFPEGVVISETAR
jgi:hypothetical protein